MSQTQLRSWLTNVLSQVPREFPPEGLLQNNPVPRLCFGAPTLKPPDGVEWGRQVRSQGGVGLLAVRSAPQLAAVQQSKAGC